jgi:enamine deaminase RidA (YjgF/YER057c/UK114 family)
MTIETRLSELGITLPEPSVAVANYLPVVEDGGLITVSGQLPLRDGQLTCTGYVGGDVSVEDAYQAARLCAINGLALIKQAAGSLERVRIIRVGGFVASAAGFTGQPKVINGASDLLVDVLGDRGRHARAAVGVAELPLGAAVEVEFTARIL